jgi:hypothetical protein
MIVDNDPMEFDTGKEKNGLRITSMPRTSPLRPRRQSPVATSAKFSVSIERKKKEVTNDTPVKDDC